MRDVLSLICFFFNDTATPEIYPLSLHDALPISMMPPITAMVVPNRPRWRARPQDGAVGISREVTVDRKSTRLNSSHVEISYAVFCLKKKNEKPAMQIPMLDRIDHRSVNNIAWHT